MPDILGKIPFTEKLLPYVQDFDCGSEEWQRPLAAWIKAGPQVKDGALGQMQQKEKKRRVQVWLHVNTANDLVGYSSLCLSKWPWPLETDPRVPISLIPCVAIDKRFWSAPVGDPPKYSTQILEHLIFEARRFPDREPLLGLFVDPRNRQAIRAYEKTGFQFYWKQSPGDGVVYQAMLLKLSD